MLHARPRIARPARLIPLLVLIGLLALVPTAVAGKGGRADASRLELVVLNPPDANHGEQVTFQVSTTATDRPFVGLRCYQGANWVFDGYVGYFPDYPWNQWFVLDSDYWVAGVAADCTARLFYYDRQGREKLLATLSFPVAP